ncbi:MAG: hypothetical protein LUG56_08685 [Lachnospiraceae bacterium]|nr:hypothetical protein [Lachnospiraceae bacterium]
MNSASEDQTPAKEKAADLSTDPRRIPKANRNVKDSVFRNLFSDKKYLLMLYQTLHPEDQDCTEDDLTCVTLEQILIRNIYNDLGFLAGDRLLIMVEAQSTWSVNIIIRSMLYITRAYQDYLRESGQSLFSTKPVHLPIPELYVIYTGNKKIEKDFISLTEEFFSGIQTSLEVRVKVLTGEGRADIMSGELEHGCVFCSHDIISQYVTFTHIINEQIRTYGQTRQAIANAIQICTDRNILKEYLNRQRKEVIDIMFTLFDQDEVLKDYMISERREVAEKVAKETEERVARETEERVAKEMAQAMYQDRYPIKVIAKYVRTNPETVRKWLGPLPQT